MLNPSFSQLSPSYLFAEIAHRVQQYRQSHPQIRVISLGIGDVTQPLPQASIEAMHRAVDDMAKPASFHGYGPEQGYAWLRETIVEHDYRSRATAITADEIFVSDGAKSDCGNLGDLFSQEATVGVIDPVYPVYVDSNRMAGRSVRLLQAIPEEHIDIIYLCYPNNPTGAVLTRSELQAWVDYALREEAVLFYDSAYEAYIRHDDIPHSIYEIPGAERCAIEIRSFSKTAGFTGIRCGYTVVPKALVRDGVSLHQMWLRRQCTKFNGASYISQRAAEAIYTPEGKAQTRRTIDYYMRNAQLLSTALRLMGYEVSGGEDAPYLWVRVPKGYDSWTFFDHLLTHAGLVCTPGAGFGAAGEGYVRLTAFGLYEDCLEAITRLQHL